MEFFIGVAFFLLGVLCKDFIPGYAKKKGENIATKEDIEDITHKVESVKSVVESKSETEKSKRELKIEACKQALKIVDAFLSQFIVVNNADGTQLKPAREEVTAADVRRCHNNLILSCENPEIIELYMSIVLSQYDGEEAFAILERLRNIIREEIGFGKCPNISNEKAWVFGPTPKETVNKT